MKDKFVSVDQLIVVVLLDLFFFSWFHYSTPHSADCVYHGDAAVLDKSMLLIVILNMTGNVILNESLGLRW